MTERDVLIERLFTPEGTAVMRSPLGAQDLSELSEAVWRVTATGQPARIISPFQDALDLALEWVQETGGEIYRLDVLGGTPELFKPTA